ncbi:hypothetical protein [Streptomyces sp. NBC_01013]|uniref:hypothetical protein n=1 Tax=Streptomyces sp. NBC_01013 TaxID=2903718 RepID=UPI003864D777|nr:hypothetical protein OG538_16615 [Streptomyces sp. NBC_01013]
MSVQHAEPEGRWCREHATPPVRPGPRRKARAAGRQWARAELTELLTTLLTDPDTVSAADTLQLRLAAMDPPVRHRNVHLLVRGLPLEHEARARAFARCLVRTGHSRQAVCIGLALLARIGEPEDVPDLETLGLLRDLVGPVVHALDTMDKRAAALLFLRNQEEAPELRGLLAALGAGDDRAVRERLAALPRTMGPEIVRRAAEASWMQQLLRSDVPAAEDSGPLITPRPGNAALLAQAGWMLFLMARARDYSPEILLYREAVPAHESFARGARHLAPTLDHYALLLSAVQELRSGPVVLHDWGPGQREALLSELVTVLDRAEWRAVVDRDGEDAGGRRRTEWARRVRRQLSHGQDGPVEGLRIEITDRDPADPATVETRILVDGRPLVPEVFGRGPAHSPEWLLDSGRLRAAEEPREVQLAEAHCTEGCCGALYVTVRRDGGAVVWSDWRCPAPPPSPLHVRKIPELRFDAAAYDAEISRAENDHTWTWPARRAARLIAAGLRERPELLTRWGVELYWASTDFRDPDQTVVYLRDAGGEGSPNYYKWCVPEDGTPPEGRAADALSRLATVDPRTYEA